MPRRKKEALQFARDQRATANDFARTVWEMVRNRGCCGEKFRREHHIGPYVADFCCVSLRLIIEVDGENHFTEEGKLYDRRRDDFMVRRGYLVLRISGYDVLNHPLEVRKRIIDAIKNCRQQQQPLTPSPSPRRGEGSQGPSSSLIAVSKTLTSSPFTNSRRNIRSSSAPIGRESVILKAPR